MIFSLLGSAFGSQFCFPKPVRFPIDDSTTYPMSMLGQEFNVKSFGYILSGLPETENGKCQGRMLNGEFVSILILIVLEVSFSI